MKIINLLFILFLCGFLVACGDTASAPSPKTTDKTIPESTTILEKLSVEEFQAKINKISNEQIVDVRSIEELVETGKIAGAKHIDYHGQKFNSQIDELDKDRPVMVYCKSGGRSGKTAKMLQQMRFKEVYDMKGGMTSWQIKNMPTEPVDYD
ncbi:MAG: rhodanese-like domain-containing protein [Chitinophagales bacterium]